ncbi:MAG: metallopeptidase family protein [Phycisphaeraceae bacterium]|nr:metallopeptidase family protein [Phycisphaeraceae bacterium]
MKSTNPFDSLLEQHIAQLPDWVAVRLEEIPVIVDDEPSDETLNMLGLKRRSSELCGLHTGIPMTLRSVEQPWRLPDHIQLFRGPINRVARASQTSLSEQIRITLLHEIGHHFGLDEDQLTQLGYG